MIIISFLIYLNFVIFELIPIFKQKKMKEFWVYSAFLGISMVLHVLISQHYNLASPNEPIKKLVQFVIGYND